MTLAPLATGAGYSFLLQEQRIARRRLDRGIAENRGCCRSDRSRVAVQEKQRHCVIDARIRVINDLVHMYPQSNSSKICSGFAPGLRENKG